MSTPRPILLVTEIFPPAIGGSAVLYDEIYGRLRDRVVHVLTDTVTSPGADGPRGGVDQVWRRPIRTDHWGARGAASHLALARRIAALGRRLGAEVHTGRALPEGLAALAGRFLGGPPFSCWAHGEEIATATDSRELDWLQRRIFRGAARIFANSHNTARMVADLGLPPDRITVIHPGVNPAVFNPGVDGSALRERYLDGAAGPLLLTVGRLQRRKGHDLVIEAVSRLRDALPGLRYVIAGDGEERPRLEALALQLGLDDRVVFAGKVPWSTLPAHYAACDVFVHPNRVDGKDVEGFGIVFLEAQATARPVIGGDNGGVPEAVSAGESGLLVSGTDASELAAAIARLAADEALRLRLGAAGRARVTAGLTWDRAAEALAAATKP